MSDVMVGIIFLVLWAILIFVVVPAEVVWVVRRIRRNREFHRETCRKFMELIDELRELGRHQAAQEPAIEESVELSIMQIDEVIPRIEAHVEEKKPSPRAMGRDLDDAILAVEPLIIHQSQTDSDKLDDDQRKTLQNLVTYADRLRTKRRKKLAKNIRRNRRL